MTEPERAESSQVSLLVPHPARTAVLVAADEASSASESGTPTALRLPSLRVPSAEPLLPDVLAHVDVVDTRTTPVLRQVVTSSTGGGSDGETRILVEFEPGASEPPPGWTWQDVDTEVVGRLQPESARAAVASWARERAEGWSSYRPPWSRPGWLARASAWMADQMAADGHPALEPPHQHQLWGVSVVLRAPSDAGDAFFKSSADIFRHEARVTQALARQMPEHVPEVIAADEVEGWLLMRDLGAPELGDQDESLWHEGLAAAARIHQLWLGRTDELVDLGLPVRSLTDLAVQVEETTEDAVLLGRMTPDLRERWLATVPTLAESCRRLDGLGPGPTLVHGDLHPWNVVSGPGGARVFDWTDAAVSHPCVDLATYVFRTEDVPTRRLMVEAYVAAWSTDPSAVTIREAATLGLVVGTLYQVQTYRFLLPALADQGAYDDLAGADLDWIDRSLSRHRLGLESPR